MTYNRKTALKETQMIDSGWTGNEHRSIWRLRERLMTDKSFEGFDDVEILSTVLSYADLQTRTGAARIARRLLDSFGSLKGVLEARPEQLMNVEGMSRAEVSLLAMIIPICRIWIRESMEKQDEINNPDDAVKYCKSILIGERIEKIYVIALNARYKVVGKRCISTGTISEVETYPRIVAETALNYNARSILLCHNHPGGTVSASREDIRTTRMIQAMLCLIHIKLLDHIIVAGDQTYSLYKNGDIDEDIKIAVEKPTRNAKKHNEIEACISYHEDSNAHCEYDDTRDSETCNSVKTTLKETDQNNSGQIKNEQKRTFHLGEQLMFEKCCEGVDDADILSTILRCATIEKSDGITLIARQLLNRFGSLKRVLEARPEQLMSVKGMGVTEANILAMIAPLYRVWTRERMEKREQINTIEEAEDYCRNLLIGKRTEKFYLIGLNAIFEVIGKKCICSGPITEVQDYSRVVTETALNLNAKYVLLCHNHPDGTFHASSQEVGTTRCLQSGLYSEKIYLFDHIIVVGDQTYSMIKNEDIYDQIAILAEIANETKEINKQISNLIPREKNKACCRSKDKEVSEMPYNKKAFGIVISRLRVQKGLTQEELSGLAGIARSHLAALESGEKVVKLNTMWRIADALKIRPSDLMNRIEEESKTKKGKEDTHDGR